MDKTSPVRQLEGAQSVDCTVPSEGQLERLQAMCQFGAAYSQIAGCLGVYPTLLRWWARQHDKAGDALRLARSNQLARADLKIQVFP